MKVILVEPQKKPKVIDLEPTLSAMQNAVGGYIQAIYPFVEESTVALVCHDEGKLLNLPFNRALYSPDTGECYDIIAGTLFLCSAPLDSDSFESLTEEQIAHYSARFRHTEAFLRINGSLICGPIQEESDD